jgi:hypothetical protein
MWGCVVIVGIIGSHYIPGIQIEIFLGSIISLLIV